jgi:hypothetical protein
MQVEEVPGLTPTLAEDFAKVQRHKYSTGFILESISYDFKGQKI